MTSSIIRIFSTQHDVFRRYWSNWVLTRVKAINSLFTYQTIVKKELLSISSTVTIKPIVKKGKKIIKLFCWKVHENGLPS